MNSQVTNSLTDKVALITGAGRGIGQAIAIGYAQAGAKVSCAARTLPELEKTVQTIQDYGGEACAIPTDVTDYTAVQTMVNTTVEQFGKIDILVINAGAYLEKESVEDSNPALWEATIQVNLIGAYYCAKATIPILKQNEQGKIIIIGSGAGHRGKAGVTAYACSKAGAWMLTRILAQELLPDNIAVNELIPGPVNTNLLTEQSFSQHKPVFNNEWRKSPEDVVPLALFLASQPIQGPTGQSFSLMRRDT